MMARRLGLVAICGVGLALSLELTASAQVVTLQELERMALQRRPAFDADAASERAADADVRRARSAYYPSLGLTAQSGVAPGTKLRELPDIVPVDEDDDGDVDYYEPGDGENFLVSGVQPATESGAFDPLWRYGAGVELKTSLYDFG